MERLKYFLKKVLKNHPKILSFLKSIYSLSMKFSRYVGIEIYRLLHFSETLSADVVISVGNHCQAAWYMQEYGLRKFASPLDWMKYYSLQSVYDLFKSGFKDFFCHHYEDEIKAKENDCRWVIDKNTGMISRHHFLKEIPLQDQFEDFYEKQIQRFHKMDHYLKQAKNIVLVSCREDSIEEMGEFLYKFQTLYDKNLTLLNFRDSKTQTYKKTFKINSKIKIVEYCFDNTYPLKKDQTKEQVGGIVWIGNYKCWGGGVKLIKLSRKIKYNVKSAITGDRY